MRTKKRNIIFMGMLIGIIIVSGVRLYIRELKVYSGVPDLISSFLLVRIIPLLLLRIAERFQIKNSFQEK